MKNLKIDYIPGIEIQKNGYEILAKELGTLNFIRFIQEFDTGEGNYTEDRHKWQDKYTVDEIIKDIKNL